MVTWAQTIFSWRPLLPDFRQGVKSKSHTFGCPDLAIAAKPLMSEFSFFWDLCIDGWRCILVTLPDVACCTAWLEDWPRGRGR